MLGTSSRDRVAVRDVPGRQSRSQRIGPVTRRTAEPKGRLRGVTRQIKPVHAVGGHILHAERTSRAINSGVKADNKEVIQLHIAAIDPQRNRAIAIAELDGRIRQYLFEYR